MTLFDRTALARQVQTAIKEADLPPDRTVAIVGVVDTAGARAVIATRIGDRWIIEGTVAHQ
jgi:hypothetical protein